MSNNNSIKRRLRQLERGPAVRGMIIFWTGRWMGRQHSPNKVPRLRDAVPRTARTLRQELDSGAFRPPKAIGDGLMESFAQLELQRRKNYVILSDADYAMC